MQFERQNLGRYLKMKKQPKERQSESQSLEGDIEGKDGLGKPVIQRGINANECRCSSLS